MYIPAGQEVLLVCMGSVCWVSLLFSPGALLGTTVTLWLIYCVSLVFDIIYPTFLVSWCSMFVKVTPPHAAKVFHFSGGLTKDMRKHRFAFFWY